MIEKRTRKCLLASVIFLGLSQTSYAEQTLEYRLAMQEDGKTYSVYMQPTVTPEQDISLTGQITLVVPHMDGAESFQVANLSSQVDGVSWAVTSRVNSPAENPAYDYISLSFTATHGKADGFAWQTGQEQQVISFSNTGSCFGEVFIMEDSDPFNQQPNSVNTNPGNQFTNVGWGEISENNYLGNYGEAVTCNN